MLVHELLKSADYTSVWQEIKKTYYADNKETDKIRDIYRKLLEDLQNISPNIQEGAYPAYLICARYYDDVCCVKDSMFFSCCMYDTKEQSEYSLMLVPWEEVLGYIVAPFSIEHFDINIIAAHIMYELSWFGFTKNEVEEGMKEMKNSLIQAQKEIADEKTHCIEEICEDGDLKLPDIDESKRTLAEMYMSLNKEISRQVEESILNSLMKQCESRRKSQ